MHVTTIEGLGVVGALRPFTPNVQPVGNDPKARPTKPESGSVGSDFVDALFPWLAIPRLASGAADALGRGASGAASDAAQRAADAAADEAKRKLDDYMTAARPWLIGGAVVVAVGAAAWFYVKREESAAWRRVRSNPRRRRNATPRTDLATEPVGGGRWRWVLLDDDGGVIKQSRAFGSEDESERNGRAAHPEARFIGEL